MEELPFKICSICGTEYSIEASICADCGGNLVFPQKYEQYSVPLEETEAEVLIRQGAISYLKELGGLLNKNGIRSVILFHGCEPGT